MKNVLFAITVTCLIFTSGVLYCFASGKVELRHCSSE